MEQHIVQSKNLIEKINKGESDLINELIAIWQKRVYNMAFKMLHNHDQSMDVMQKVFIKVYKSLNQLKEPEKFKSWLYRIVINYCKSELRKPTRVIPIDDQIKQRTDSEHKRYTQYDQDELKEVILTSLQKIPEEQKIIIVMKEYEGFKFHEIADTLDISINTAKSRLYYGLKSMRKVILNNPKSKAIYYELYNH